MSCNHNPITLYHDGGRVVICRYCRAVLKPWRRNGESGQAWLIYIGIILVMFAVVVGAQCLTENRVIADCAGGLAFLALFAAASRMMKNATNRKN